MNNSLARLLTLLLLSTGLLSSCDSKSTNPDNKSTDSVASAVIPWNSTVTYGVLVDNRDAQTYRTVQIGTQTWMAENLNYRNALDSTDTVGACYNNSVDSCLKYGRLYTWIEVMGIDSIFQSTLWGGSDINHQGICPTGWHVPSDTEWSTLAINSGGDSSAAANLRSTNGWGPYTDSSILGSGLYGSNSNGTDRFGFRVLPAGNAFIAMGLFYDAGESAFFTSRTERDSSDVWVTWFPNAFPVYDDSIFEQITNSKKDAISLRCIKDML
jgi:uncharacterized protein (TIGR02145 family)